MSQVIGQGRAGGRTERAGQDGAPRVVLGKIRGPASSSRTKCFMFAGR